MNMRPMNVRVSEETLETLEELSRRLDMRQSEVIRLAMAIGIEEIAATDAPARLVRAEARRRGAVGWLRK